MRASWHSAEHHPDRRGIWAGSVRQSLAEIGMRHTGQPENKAGQPTAITGRSRRGSGRRAFHGSDGVVGQTDGERSARRFERKRRSGYCFGWTGPTPRAYPASLDYPRSLDPGAVGNGGQISFYFDANADEKPERRLDVRYTGRQFSAVMVDRKGRFVGRGLVRQTSPGTVVVSFPRSLLREAISYYRWFAFTGFRCHHRYKVCGDTSPQRGRWISHRLGSSPSGTEVKMGETRVPPYDDCCNADLLSASRATLDVAGEITSISFYVRTAHGHLRLGIYDDSGHEGGPGERSPRQPSSWRSRVGIRVLRSSIPGSHPEPTGWPISRTAPRFVSARVMGASSATTSAATVGCPRPSQQQLRRSRTVCIGASTRRSIALRVLLHARCPRLLPLQARVITRFSGMTSTS